MLKTIVLTFFVFVSQKTVYSMVWLSRPLTNPFKVPKATRVTTDDGDAAAAAPAEAAPLARSESTWDLTNAMKRVTIDSKLVLEPLTQSRFKEKSNPAIFSAIRDTLRAMRHLDWEKAYKSSPPHLINFYTTPRIAFSDYFNHCIKYSQCTDSSCLVALILITKFIKKTDYTSFNTATIYKLFFAALFIAINIIEDSGLIIKDAIKISGTNEQSFAQLWPAFLEIINHDFEGLMATTEHLLKTIDWEHAPVPQLLDFFKIPRVASDMPRADQLPPAPA